MDTQTAQIASDWYRAKVAEVAECERQTVPSESVDNARFLVGIAYQRLGTWDAVAAWYGDGHSRASYHRLAKKDKWFYPSQELIAHIEAHALPPLRRTIAIPESHNVDVYMTPDGNGKLTVHDVPDGNTVALIPAGSRIIPPSPRKRPPYRRPTWAMVRAMQAELDDWHASMQATIDPCADEQHCACVPYLRRHIAELEAQLEAQR